MSVTVEREEFTRSCYCRRGYGGNIRVCGHDSVRDKRWVIFEDGKRTRLEFRTKKEAVAYIEGGAQA